MTRQSARAAPAHAAPPLRVAPETASRALRVLLLVACALAAISLAAAWVERSHRVEGAALMVLHFVNVDLEHNLPTWYAVSTLFACAAASAVIPFAAPLGRGLKRRHWLTLAVAFAAVSLDEMAAMHERLSLPMQSAWGSSGLLRHAAWVIPGGIAVLALAVSMIPFLRNLPGRTRAIFVAAGAIYVCGGLVAESASGPFALRYGTEGVGYAAFTTFEELLEMVGVAVMIYGLLDYLARRAGEPAGAAAHPGRPTGAAASSPRLLRGLAAVAVGLASASFAGAVAGRALEVSAPVLAVFRFLDVGEESNLPTWYATVLLLACATLAARAAAVAPSRARGRARWWLLAATFAVASLDEMAMMHERLSNRLLASAGGAGLVQYAGVALGVLAAAAFALAMLPLLRDLPDRTRATFLAAGATYVSGAVLLLVARAIAARQGPGIGYDALVTLQELLEMLGSSVMLHGLVRHLRSHPTGAPAVRRHGSTAASPWPAAGVLPEP